jgi:hypothetical protein
MKRKQSVVQQNQKKVIENKFESGLWRIDSIAENDNVVVRLLNNDSIQILNFEKNGTFSTVDLTKRITKTNQIGTWKADFDSIYIFNDKAKLFLIYGYDLRETGMVLNSRFSVSEKNKNKPCLYLSKYKMDSKESIFGSQ